MPCANVMRSFVRPGKRVAFIVASFVVPVVCPFASAAQPTRVSFSHDIAPILQRSCIPCHGPDKSKGHFRLDSFASLLKSGDSEKPTIIAGKPDASHLYQLIVEKNPDDRMPQKSEALPSSDVALIRKWVADGAKFDGPDRDASLASLLPGPVHPPAPVRYSQPWPVTAISFNPDGTQLIVGGCRELTIWNATNGTLLRRIGGMPERIHALAWQPGGDLLAVAGGSPGRSGEVLLFDITSNVPPLELAITSDEMLCAAFSPDGQRLAAGGADKILRVFSANSGAPILKLEQHADWVHHVEFSADGKKLASASRDRTAHVFDSTSGEITSTFRGHDGAVESLIFTDDGKTILSVGADRIVRSWNTATGEKAKDFTKFDVAITAMISADNFMFIATADGRVTQWRISDRKRVREFVASNDRIDGLAFHSATHRIAAGSHDGRVHVWSFEDGGQLTQFIASPGLEHAVKK